MKQLRAVSFLLALSFQLIAQNDFPRVGTFWNYSGQAHNGGGWAYETIEVVKDTLINGIHQKLLMSNFFFDGVGGPFPGGCSDYSYSQPLGYMFERNDSVFIDDQYLYSFKMDIGDTVYPFPNDTLPPFHIYYVVDSFSFVNIDGMDLRKTFLTQYCSDSQAVNAVTIIEDIGPVDDYLLLGGAPGYCVLFAGCAMEGRGFSCFNDSQIMYPSSCNRLVTSINNSLKPVTEMTVLPNYSSNQIEIRLSSSDDGTLTLSDLAGKILAKTTTSQSQASYAIGLPQLPAGLYLVSFVNSGNQVISKKLLVQYP